ncbi:MAG: hypothetical protein GJ671_08825 [Alteromonadaceae bacterium]|nr:hypothetical protein [Alteromonadaceae bacterium]
MCKLGQQDLIRLFVMPHTALEYNETQWSGIVQLLRHEKLLARYGYRMADHHLLEQLPLPVQHHFNNAMDVTARHIHQVHHTVKHIHRLLGESYPMIVLKGAAYTLLGDVVSRGRIYSDIDIWVQQADIAGAEQQLKLTGWFRDEMDDYDERYYREWAHEIPPMYHGASGAVLDMHHNIVPPVSGRAVDVSFFTQHTEVTASGVRVLSLPARTLHSTIHLLFNEECEYALRDLTDLVLMFEQFSLDDWYGYLALAEQTGFAREGVMAITLCQNMLNLSVPDAIVKQALPIQKEVSTRVLVALYQRIMASSHPLVASRLSKVCETFIWLRGHYLKMPWTLLLYHIMMKAYRSTAQILLGRHIFTKTDPESVRPFKTQQGIE